MKKPKYSLKGALISNLVPIVFLMFAAFAVPMSGLSIQYLLHEMITRLARDSLLVLSLIIPVLAGMGLNFGMVLGAVAGQIGLVLVVDWGIGGMPALLVAALVGTPISIGLGYFCGYILNLAKGREMVTSYIIGFFMKLPENIGNALSSMYKSVSDWMSKTKTEINNSTTKMGSDFVAWLSKIPGQISTYFSNMYKNVSAWMDNMKWAIATALTTMFWNFVTWLGKLPSMVSNYFSSMSRNTSAWQNDLVNKASQIGRNMYNGIANWFNSLPDSVYNALSNIGKNISNFTSYLWSRAKSLGDSVWQGFKVGMGMHSPSYIEQAFMSISASATDTLKNIKTVVPKYQAALNTLKAPALDIAGANYGTVGVDYGFMNETPLEQNNFNIGSLVVREDADIYKIAQELFKLQQANLRAKGR